MRIATGGPPLPSSVTAPADIPIVVPRTILLLHGLPLTLLFLILYRLSSARRKHAGRWGGGTPFRPAASPKSRSSEYIHFVRGIDPAHLVFPSSQLLIYFTNGNSIRISLRSVHYSSMRGDTLPTNVKFLSFPFFLT